MERMISVAVLDPGDPTTVKSVTEALKEYQTVIIPCASGEAFAFCHRAPVGRCRSPQAG